MRPRRIRTRRRSAGLAAAALLLAGCGGGGARLDRTDASRLIALAHRIAAEPACAQARDIPRLRAQTISLVNDGRVPARLQEPLMSGVSALAEQTPVCLRPVAATSTTPAPPAPAPAAARPVKEKHHGHGHGHGHGKKK